MPCYSSIKQTQILHQPDLVAGLQKLGYTVRLATDTRVEASKDGRTIAFARSNKSVGFQTESDFVGLGIAQAASEATVRRVYKKQGFLIEKTETVPQRQSVRLTMNNRS